MSDILTPSAYYSQIRLLITCHVNKYMQIDRDLDKYK